MGILQDTFDSFWEEFLAEKGWAGSPEELIREVRDMIPELADSAAQSMLSEIKKGAESELKANRKQQRGFEKRLNTRWEAPLNLLELLISLALEAGSKFNDEHRGNAELSNDLVFAVLTLLHSRSCQIASAILVLLRSGYADDAYARWRALHEISIVSNFISANGSEVAERYLLHDGIQRYKLALKYQKHAEAINEEPLPEEEFNELQDVRNELINRFEEGFDGEYGWAASALGKSRVTFADIEEAVDLEHWRPYYRMASDSVHGNVRGAYFRLGLSPKGEGVLLAGPSDMGLADPGHSTAISLQQVTTTLLATKPNLDNIVIMKMLQQLQKEIGEAFLEVHSGKG